MRSRQRFEAIPPGGVGIYPPGKSVLSGREAPYALVHVLGAVEDKVDFTVGIGFGANILHGGGDLQSFYQILALKIDMTRDTFLHVGYNLKDFHEPNYLMLGIGYRFNNRRPRLYR